jgi:nickel/cobalt transporter (NicO) family protein
MKRFAIALLLLAAWLVPGVASAHPLGNFTVNHYTRIEPAGDRVRLVYVLDMAEIPTFQEKPRIESSAERYADERAEQIRQNLHLTLDGQPAALHLQSRALSFPEGQGGLSTLRLEAVYATELRGDPNTPVEIMFRDDNEPNRIGWREIIARSGAAGTSIERASVPSEDTTHELRQYPEDLLNSPLNVREAHLTFVPGAAAARPLLASSGVGVLDRTRSAFAELANGAELTPGFVLFALAVAVVLGAAHALQPGHGKTVVAAYLVGSRGTWRHAVFLGATVTTTHTAGVYALGLVTLFLSQYIVPERLYPILEILSGLLVVAIGVWLFGGRLLSALRPAHQHDHEHQRDHEHQHDHGHEHPHPHPHTHPHGPVGIKSLLALGISGGLLPCPEALMVLLITIAAHKVLFGLLLIVAFSTGLASVLVGFGLLLVFARSFFQRINVTGGLVPRVLPVASAAVIVVAGFVITAQALPQVL